MDAFFEQWREPDRIFTLAGLICLIGGIGICLRGQWKVHRARSWQATTGRIISGSVQRQTTHHYGSSPNMVYVARIAYEYVVGGREYQGSRIAVGGELNTSGRGRAQQRLEQYPQGAAVEVFYDPHDPASACLERRTEVVGMGMLFVAAGLCILLYTATF